MSRILVIDSDPGSRAAIVHALEALSEVDQASNGVEALRFLATKKYTLILLDLHVRIIDGFVILHTLASRPGPNKETPIYVLTADVSEHSRLRALREHAVFVLTKPVSITTVTTLVEAGLKKAAAPSAEGGTSSRPPPPEDGSPSKPPSSPPRRPTLSPDSVSPVSRRASSPSLPSTPPPRNPTPAAGRERAQTPVPSTPPPAAGQPRNPTPVPSPPAASVEPRNPTPAPVQGRSQPPLPDVPVQPVAPVRAQTPFPGIPVRQTGGSGRYHATLPAPPAGSKARSQTPVPPSEPSPASVAAKKVVVPTAPPSSPRTPSPKPNQ